MYPNTQIMRRGYAAFLPIAVAVGVIVGLSLQGCATSNTETGQNPVAYSTARLAAGRVLARSPNKTTQLEQIAAALENAAEISDAIVAQFAVRIGQEFGLDEQEAVDIADAVDIVWQQIIKPLVPDASVVLKIDTDERVRIALDSAAQGIRAAVKFRQALSSTSTTTTSAAWQHGEPAERFTSAKVPAGGAGAACKGLACGAGCPSPAGQDLPGATRGWVLVLG